MNDFENKFEDLEKIIEKLSAGNLTLEQSIKNYEKGVKLSKELQAALEKNQKRINVILEGKEVPLAKQDYDQISLLDKNTEETNE